MMMVVVVAPPIVPATAKYKYFNYIEAKKQMATLQPSYRRRSLRLEAMPLPQSVP